MLFYKAMRFTVSPGVLRDAECTIGVLRVSTTTVGIVSLNGIGVMSVDGVKKFSKQGIPLDGVSIPIPVCRSDASERVNGLGLFVVANVVDSPRISAYRSGSGSSLLTGRTITRSLRRGAWT